MGEAFRVGNLTALRELALLWVADKVDEQLERYRADHGIAGTWEARERVVVALSGGPEGDTLIRRAARIAARTKGTDLMAVHVTPSHGLQGADPAHLARQRVLAKSIGGTYHQVDILIVMVVVVAAAIIGGFWPGIAAAVAGFLLLNYYFTQPYHTFAMSRPDDVIALAVFVVVAAAVSAVVGLAARRTREAARAGADAEVLFNLVATCCAASTR